MSVGEQTLGGGRGVPLLNFTGIKAVWRRELASLLGNPLGYFFILVFVLATSVVLFWYNGKDFFARNISDLNYLVGAMPWILAVLLPALAMGSWAREREQGTEELLLTLPLSVIDALSGKFLAVGSYFTIALACSLSNVVALMWLGHPDLGLVFANYLGWWLAGLSFAAISIFASVLFSLPAIAFVVGVALCAGVAGLAAYCRLFDAFNRGVAPLFTVVAAVSVMFAGLGAAALVLASRRWRPGSAALVWVQILTLVFSLGLAANVAEWAQRHGAYQDLSAEQLSSLSGASKDLLEKVDRPVTITAFLSTNLPPELMVKAKEIEDTLAAIQRYTGKVRVDLRQPVDELDKDGQLASREYSIKSRPVLRDEVTGREPVEIYLGAAIASAGNSQVIDYFDPGLSVEYEIMRAISSVLQDKKPTLGIAETDMHMNGGFDMQGGMLGGGMIPQWEMVKEWQKQYKIQSVNLDADVETDIGVLVVAQPSSLTQPQIEHLHHYIFSGRPALLLEDPVFVSSRKAALIPGQPKQAANPYGGEEQNAPKKGDIKELWKALGLDFDEDQLVASEYDPSHYFHGSLPNTILWTDITKAKDPSKSICLQGINTLLFFFAGELKPASDKYSGLTFAPLVGLTPGYPWGTDRTESQIQVDYGGSYAPARQGIDIKEQLELDDPPAVAAEITGQMKAGFPEVDPADKAEPAKGQVGPPTPERKVGVLSAKDKPIDVVVVADADCFSDLFFSFYRNDEGNFNADQMHELGALNNVQFALNLVDHLFKNDTLNAIRSRRPIPRPLQTLDEMLAKSAAQDRLDEEKAKADADKAIGNFRSKMQADVDKIRNDQRLDASAIAQTVAGKEKDNERALQIEMARINLDRDQSIKASKSARRNAIRDAQMKVQALAIATPAVLLLVLALVVFILRIGSERSHIPASRRRASE